jgi:membrane protein DedA with SNARE-associated domain
VSFSQVLRDLGYAGLALLLLAETIFPPIPSEAILPLAGYLVERGEMHFALVVVVATAGSTAGAVFLYEAARRGGRPFAERFLRRARMDQAQLARAEEWFARRGPLVVLAGRCVPGVRSLISLPAGVLRMPRWEYVLFTAIGSAIWNTLLVGAGYLLGHEWERVSAAVEPFSTPIIVLVVGASAVWLLRRGLRGR